MMEYDTVRRGDDVYIDKIARHRETVSGDGFGKSSESAEAAMENS